MFPNIKLGEGKTMLFDRILADVPYVDALCDPCHV
jgi:hypothetical protein